MKKLFSILLFVLLFTMFTFQTALAQNSPNGNNKNNGSTPCTGTSGACSLANPLGSISTPQALIGQVINTVLGVVGSLALVMFIYGGLTWMTSSGNEEKVKKGRDIILWSAIGLVVIFLSYALTRFVLGTISQ